MCVVEASRLLRSGRMHNHKMIDEFKCRLRTLYDPDKKTNKRKENVVLEKGQLELESG